MIKEGQTNKESIQVTIRVRPLSDKQLNEDSRLCIRVDKESQSLVLQPGIGNAEAKAFTFDSICDVDNSQQDIFLKVGINSTERCLQGYNCCIFAYGQTGAGKTFTMMGVNYEDSLYFDNRGLIPRTLEYLFECIDREVVEQRAEYLVKCTFLQIYNEQIIDLLNKSNSNLQLRQDLKKGVYVEGLSEQTVSRSEEAMQILRRGSKGRHVGSTCYNETSSRSHSVFSMLLESKAIKNGIINVKTRRFHFIDLAGSERTKQSNGERLKEGCSINKSLHVLGMVINSLVQSTEGKARHVNYRDSKLTFLLKDALGGNSKTHLIANISPNTCSCSETLSTLTFARRVKLIKLNKVSINEDASGNLESLKSQIRRLKQQIVHIRSGYSRQLIMQDSEQVSSFSNAPESKQITCVMINNQKKLGLEKILQQYIEESIEKDTKFELELLKRDQKLSLLKEALSQYSKNETHLRMIIALYQEKFKRLKNLEGNLNKKMQELGGAEKEQILGHLSVEKELLARELQQYKELLSETPFMKSLMKNVNLLPDEKQEESVNAQLAGNLSFLKELKAQLDQTVRERQELNSLIENYSMNKEQQMSPKKRISIERQFEAKELEYKEKLQQMELETAFLKGATEQTELLLKDSVDRQMTLEDKLRDKTIQLAKFETQLKAIQEREHQKCIALLKEKQDCQRDFELRMTNMSLQQLELRKAVEKHLDSLSEAQKKNKRQDEAIQQLIRDLAEMQLRNDFMEKMVKEIQQKAQQDREAVASSQETIIKLSGILEQVKIERDEAMSQTEAEKQTKKILKEDLQGERETLTAKYNQRIEAMNQQIDSMKTKETDMIRQISELRNECDSKSQKILSWEQKHHSIIHQLELQRSQLKKREDQIKDLLHKKANTDTQLQTQVNNLSLQLMSQTEQLKTSGLKMQELKQSLYTAEQKLFETERQVDIKSADIQRLNEQFEFLKQKERATQKARQQSENVTETLKHFCKEEQEKYRKAQSEVDRLKQKEKELQQSCLKLQDDIETSQHRMRQSVNAGTKISEQLRELTEEFDRKERTLEKMRQSHGREITELKQQIESQKQKSLTHEAYMKKVFDECMSNKDKIMSDLKCHNNLMTNQMAEETRKTEEYRLKLRESESRLKELSEIVAEKDASISEVNQHILLLKDEIEHMKNIYEQKMEERQNNYNQFIDRKNESIDKLDLEKKKIVTQMQELRVSLDTETVFSRQKSQQIVELSQQITTLTNAMQAVSGVVLINSNNILQDVDQIVKQLVERENQNRQKSNTDGEVIKKLNESVAILQQEVSLLSGQLKQSKERIQLLQQESMKNGTSNQSIIAVLEEELQKEKANKSDLSSELSHTIGMLNAELTNQHARFESVEQRLNKRIVELEKQQISFEGQAKLIGQVTSEFNTKISELEQRLQNTTLEMETIQSQFNESEVKVRELNDSLEQKEIALTKTKNTLSHRVRELEYELQTVQRSLQEQVKLKEASRGSEGEKEKVFNTRIDGLKGDNEELRAQTTNLYNQLSEQQARINKMEVKEINLTKQNSQLESERRQLANKLSVLSEEIKQRSSLAQSLQKEKQKSQRLTNAVEDYKLKLANQLKQSESFEVQLNNERFDEMKRMKEEFLNEVHKSNCVAEQLSRENNRLKDQAQKIISKVESERDQVCHQNEQLKLHISVLSQECENLREQITLLSEKCEQLDRQGELQQKFQEELRTERTNTSNLKKLIDNLQRQKMQLEAEIQDKDETQKRLLAKMTKVEQAQPKFLQQRKSVMKTNDLLQRSRIELLQYKQSENLCRKIVEDNNKVFKKLKSDMQAKEENFVQMHAKAEEFCRNQQLKVSSIRADYEKLENEHQLLIREKERLECFREDNQNLQEELASYKAYQTKADKRLEQLQQTIQNMNSEMLEMRQELQSYRREPMRVGSDNNTEIKLQYINKIKEQNSLLKREKQCITDKLNQQTEEKLKLKAQLNHHQKKLSKDGQNRTSLNVLESMSNNVEVSLKIELEKKLGQIKYLQEGYAELCVLLGVKRLPQNKLKGDSTIGVILSLVQTLIQDCSDAKSRLREKEKQLDSKNVHYQVVNKQYNHLKFKILEAKGVKDREQSYQKKSTSNKIQNTFTSIRNSLSDPYPPVMNSQDMNTLEDLKMHQQQQPIKNREVSRTRKDKPY